MATRPRWRRLQKANYAGHGIETMGTTRYTDLCLSTYMMNNVDGAAWHGTARHVTARHGMAWLGLGLDGTGRDGTVRDETGRDGTGRDVTGWIDGWVEG